MGELTKQWQSVEHGVLTLYAAVTGGDDWFNVQRPLSHLRPHYTLAFLFYLTFFLFILANTFTSLVVEATMRSSEDDDACMIQQMLEQEKDLVRDFKNLYHTGDTDDSGDISQDEFTQMASDPKTLAWAHTLDLDLGDAEAFFSMLSCNGQIKVDPEAFVNGCIRLKGNAKSTDLMSLTFKHNRLSTLCEEQFASLRELLGAPAMSFACSSLSPRLLR